jgi:hypothetical protein
LSSPANRRRKIEGSAALGLSIILALLAGEQWLSGRIEGPHYGFFWMTMFMAVAIGLKGIALVRSSRRSITEYPERGTSK